MANLKSILDTPEKKVLYLLLGKVIPAPDQPLFWQHAEPFYNQRERSGSIGRTKTVASVQKHHFDTMPSRTKPSELYQNDEPHGKTHRKTAGSNWEADANKDVRRIVLKKSDTPDGELGFSIRGGSEHSVGIFVSMVEQNTMAEKKGLQPGDQIIQVNEIPLEKITHGEAVKVRWIRVDAVVMETGAISKGDGLENVVYCHVLIIPMVYYQLNCDLSENHGLRPKGLDHHKKSGERRFSTSIFILPGQNISSPLPERFTECKHTGRYREEWSMVL